MGNMGELMDKFAYRIDIVLSSDTEIAKEDLLGIGIEVKESVMSYLKSKRYKTKLEGDIEVSEGVIHG